MQPIPESLWTATAPAGPQVAPFAGDQRADVAVIGGGYTGLSTALFLAEAGVDVCVLERHEPGWGASGRNGGQVLACHKLDPPQMIAVYGAERGQAMTDMIGSAPDLVFSLIAKYGIECEARQDGWIQPAHNEAMQHVLRRRAESWIEQGAPVEMLDRDQVRDLVGSPLYLSGWLDKRSGGVNPLAYARGLARAAISRGARIHGDSDVLSFERAGTEFVVRTGKGTLRAEKIVIATNGYTGDLTPRLRRSIIAHNSFQLATRPLPEEIRRTILPRGQVSSDSRRILHYFRVHSTGRLLLGGRGFFAEPDSSARFAHLERAVAKIFPQAAGFGFDYHWYGRVAITPDHQAHLHEPEPGVIAALGYVGRGVALATAMGSVIARRIQGERSETLPFPITPIRTIPFHVLKKVYAATVASYYRLLDRFA